MDRDELIARFSKTEVETTEELLACVKGPVTSDLFRRLLLLFLRGHYSSGANYMGFDHLGCFTWDADETKRTLEVEYTHTDSDRKPDNYPGVYVGFGQADFNKIAQGNFAGHSHDLAGTDLSKESTANFEVSHVSKRASDAYDLAELTSRALTAMAEPLAMNAGAHSFEVLGMRKPKNKKPEPESYYIVATPVQIKYTLAVTRNIESHRIRMIALELDSES